MWVNQAWENLTGHEAQSVLGQVCHAHAPSRSGDPADLAASFHPPPEALAGRPTGTLALILHREGERIWRRVEFLPFRDQSESLIGILGIVRRTDDPPLVPDTAANRLHVELLEIRRNLQNDSGFDGVIGVGPAHRRLLEQVRLAASVMAPVLIVGAAGDRKTSGRARHPSVEPRPESAPRSVRFRSTSRRNSRTRAIHSPESPATGSER